MGRQREEARAILDRRAEELAAALDSDVSFFVEPILSFGIAGYRFGVSLKSVWRAAHIRHLTEIPGGPSHLVGVTTIAGHIISLLDFSALLSLPRIGGGDIIGAVVVFDRDRRIALAAEQLYGIDDVNENDISGLPGGGGPLNRVANLGNMRVPLVDVTLLFLDRRLSGTE